MIITEAKEYCVYKHTSPSGKVYVGITCQVPEYRWANGNGYKQCAAFFNAIKKYGWDNIQHEIVLDGLTEDEAKRKECELIKQFKAQDRKHGYNLTAGGDGMSNPSEETRRKLSAAHKGKRPSLGYRHTEDAKRRIGEASKGNTWNIGRKASEGTKAKLSKARTGMRFPNRLPPTVETRRKISEANKGRVFSEEVRRKIGESNAVPVNQYTLDGRYIKTHISASDAARELTGGTCSHIANVCDGERLSWCGYQWRRDEGANRCQIDRVDISPKTGVDHPSSKPITQHLKSGQEIARFSCITEAAHAVSGNRSNLAKCCQGKIKTAYGYIWRYANVR